MKLNRTKFHAGNVGGRKYQISRTRTVINVAGPIITACSKSEREKHCGSRRKNVIIAVGRNSTARDASVSEMDKLLAIR
jgi:hypothetical protein